MVLVTFAAAGPNKEKKGLADNVAKLKISNKEEVKRCGEVPQKEKGVSFVLSLSQERQRTYHRLPPSFDSSVTLQSKFQEVREKSPQNPVITGPAFMSRKQVERDLGNNEERACLRWKTSIYTELT